MFGLFKQKIAPEDLGLYTIELARNVIGNDAMRCLGVGIKNFDPSIGFEAAFKKAKISLENQKLFFVYYTHATLHTACLCFDNDMRQSIMRGVALRFSEPTVGYNFEDVYNELEMTFLGLRRPSLKISALENPDALINFLPQSDAGILCSRYLIEKLTRLNINRSDLYFSDFNNFSFITCTSIATMHRAIRTALASFKL